MERQPNTQYVLSLSYGKDSIATLEAIRLLGYPLDRIVHAEVWATDTISADLPPMVAFKAYADKVIKEQYGIEVEHICASKNGEKLTYEKIFYSIPNRRKPRERERGLGEKRTVLRCNEFAQNKTIIRVHSRDFLLLGQAGARSSKPKNVCGSIYGFPMRKGNWCTSNLKTSLFKSAPSMGCEHKYR